MKKKRAFSSNEDKFILKHYKKGMTAKEIGEVIGRQGGSVTNRYWNLQKKKEKNDNRNAWWTEEEEDRLKELLSVYPISEVANRMKRTEDSIRKRMAKLDIQLYRENLTLLEVADSFNTSYVVVRRWVEKKGLSSVPLKTTHGKGCVTTINQEEFWRWAEKNKKIIPFSKYKKYSILPEPHWLDDEIHRAIIEEGEVEDVKKGFYTKKEDSYLILLHRQGVSQKEIAKKLNRTQHSVSSRIVRLQDRGVLHKRRDRQVG